MKRSILIALAAVAIMLPTSAASAREGDAAMTGEAERFGPGDPGGAGTATFRIDPGQGASCAARSPGS